jgi:fibrillarin-like rRNA methylase
LYPAGCQDYNFFFTQREQLLLSSKNVHIFKKDGKEILLVCTAYISKDSAREVKELIEQESRKMSA